ncbi:MAG: hypothetical protein ABSF84_05515 [Acidimicrobiales bacterium]
MAKLIRRSGAVTGPIRQAIDRLVSAFEVRYRDNAEGADADSGVRRALAVVNGLCPVGGS